MDNLLLSLCMIVKNESEWLDQCLSSVRHAVDEIIVVDTGSEDRTKEIAKHYGAEVHEHAWTGSFAEARNKSISKARGKWILWMDADERLDERDIERLREGLKSSEEDILLVHLFNYFGIGEPDENRTYIITHHRLFRNNIGLKFIHPIHEQLHAEGGDLSKYKIGVLPVRIHHFGYMDQAVRKKNKFERNIAMLAQQVNSGTSEPWTNYHLASEYYRNGRYEEAFSHINKSILHFLAEGKMPPSMLYHMKYSILIGTGNLEHAQQGIEKAIQLYPDYVDLHFFKGVIHYKLKRYADALKSFRHCLEMGDVPTTHLSQKGRGSFYAHYYMGMAYEAMSAINQAEEAYRQALKQFPNFKEAKDRLENITASKGKGAK